MKNFCIQLYFCLLLLGIKGALLAQGEANIWYFGFNAGLDFNTSPPTPLTNGALATYEGCASIADKNGVLVFYTDGTTVWNKNHVAMPNGNGLFGNSSSTQSAIIVPYPGTYNYGTRRFNKYFIVTVDHQGGSHGVNFSEVDMTLNGGLGDVTTKNTHLYDGGPTTEKICVVQHANNCDFWVVGKPYNDVNFYAYPITSSGFNTTPVISAAGPVMNNLFGSLKASLNNKMVVATHSGAPNGIWVYDFNNTTGLLSLKFSDVSPGGYTYSQEFSTDNKILYVTALNNSNIYQYDLTVANNTDFVASRQIVGTTTNGIGFRMCALQLGSDGKIYAALQGQTSLGVINNPNTLGTGCNYVDMQQGLGGKTCQLGLPAIVTSLIRPVNKITMNDSCAQQQIQFGLLDTNKMMTDHWNFARLTSPNTSLATATVYNPIIQFDSAGDYIVTLVNNYACFIDTIIDTIAIIKPIANFTSTPVCIGSTVFFNDNSTVANNTISSWSWDFADGGSNTSSSNPSHIYSSVGTYGVKLVVTSSSGCSDTIINNVIIHPLPIVEFSANNVCDGSPVMFNDQSTIALSDTLSSWKWSLGDGTSIINQQQVTGGHIYPSAGTYNVKLAVQSNFGCSDSVTQSVIVHPNPVARFISSKVCLGASTVFSDSSITSAGTLNGWRWSFGDSSPSVLIQTPSHQYSAAGIHFATLIVQNTFGCLDTLTKADTVYFNPIANFTYSDICLHDSVSFIDSSGVDGSATVNNFVWEFNDGSPSSNLQNPHHYYNNAGTYNVSLLSTTNQGCSNTVSKNVHVYDAPLAGFTVADVCMHDSAIFVNTSSNPSIGNIAHWSWSFGDGSTLDTINSNPHHLYSSAGSYPIVLITKSSHLSCADTIADSIHVFPMPSASFSVSENCFGESTSFSDNSSIQPNNTIASWSWNFGDNGALSILQNPARTYSNYGNYNVNLIVTTNHNCKDTATNTAIVHPLPIAAFFADNVCQGNPTNFLDNSSIPSNLFNDVISSWIWDLGDNGNLSSNQNPSYQYPVDGIYTVKLNVISSYGCVDSLDKTVIVNPNPQVSFTMSDSIGCSPVCINFSDNSSISSGSNISWTWDSGDGTAYNTPSFSHCYTNNPSNNAPFIPLSYNIILTVSSDSGCTGSQTLTNAVTVYPLPQAYFTATPAITAISNPMVEFNNLSVGGDYWFWDLGDGDTSTLTTPPIHSYSDTLLYTIMLSINTQFGCTDTAYSTVLITPDYHFFIPSAFTPNGDGINDTFSPKGEFLGEFEMFIFDRWGNMVYKTDNINKPWDGKANNGKELAQSDVYVYSIKVTDFSYEKHIYRGTLTLIK